VADEPATPADADLTTRVPPPIGPGAVVDAARSWLRFVGPGRILAAAGVALVLAGVGWWLLRAPSLPTEARLPRAERASAASSAISSSSTSTIAPTTAPPPIIVHVAGAVATPGVYELEPGQRVADAIAAAGGATPGADPDALNLAAQVADGDRIAVPLAGQPTAEGHTHAADDSDASGSTPAVVVDLNTAGADELETLPGIGPATAAAIVEHRERNGPFASVDDLEQVPGIGPAKLAAIRDLVTV
jgi:competence protein ComEA